MYRTEEFHNYNKPDQVQSNFMKIKKFLDRERFFQIPWLSTIYDLSIIAKHEFSVLIKASSIFFVAWSWNDLLLWNALQDIIVGGDTASSLCGPRFKE